MVAVMLARPALGRSVLRQAKNTRPIDHQDEWLSQDQVEQRVWYNTNMALVQYGNSPG